MKATLCDACKKEASRPIVVHTPPAKRAESSVALDFCSWTCVSDYAQLFVRPVMVATGAIETTKDEIEREPHDEEAPEKK